MRIQMVVAAAGLAAVLMTTACSVSPGGRLGELKTVAKTCPRDVRVGTLVALDVRGELRGVELTDARMGAVERVATRTAVCSGRLRVVVFSASSVASVVVFDGALMPVGATENAKLRRVDGLIDKTMRKITEALPAATSRVSSRGGDPLGQLEAAREFVLELGDGFAVEAVIESSGFVRGVRFDGLDLEAARKLAAGVDVPDLSGVSRLAFAGVGRVGSGAPPSSATVAAVKAFYERVCERAKVACVVTSTVDPAGA